MSNMAGGRNLSDELWRRIQRVALSEDITNSEVAARFMVTPGTINYGMRQRGYRYDRKMARWVRNRV